MRCFTHPTFTVNDALAEMKRSDLLRMPIGPLPHIAPPAETLEFLQQAQYAYTYYEGGPQIGLLLVHPFQVIEKVTRTFYETPMFDPYLTFAMVTCHESQWPTVTKFQRTAAPRQWSPATNVHAACFFAQYKYRGVGSVRGIDSQDCRFQFFHWGGDLLASTEAPWGPHHHLLWVEERERHDLVLRKTDRASPRHRWAA